MPFSVDKERNVLFNDELIAFYLCYVVLDIRKMKLNPLPTLHELFFLASSKGSAPTHRQNSTYCGLCYTSCGALAGTKNRKGNTYVIVDYNKV